MAMFLKESLQIIVHRMILIILLSLKLVHSTSVWNLDSATCDALKDKDLQFLSRCNVTLDEKNFLHASCDLFCYAESRLPLVGYTKSVISINWILRTDQPVTSLNDRNCLRLSSLVIEKMPYFKHYDLVKRQGTILGLLTQTEKHLSKVEEGRVEVIFEKQRMVAVADYINCDINSPQFEMSAVDSKRNTSCKVAIRGVKKMIYPARWFRDFPSTKPQAVEVVEKINEVFLLDKARIPLFRIKFSKDVFDITPLLYFISFYKIECLEFPQNHFDSIRNGIFSPITTLRILNLTEGAIQMVENGTFDNLPGLETVDLSWNNLGTVPEVFYVSHLQHLSYLNMEGNKPTKGTFTLNSHNEGFSHLSILRLSKISFTELKPKSFASFPNLAVLYLDHCNFTYIEDGVLSNLSSLTTLDLSHNQITNISKISFNSLLSLKFLNLSNNRLEFIPTEVIQTLSNLSQLNLQSNFISTFTFLAHPSLTLINLTDNHIREWHMPLSDDLLLSYDLDLSSNLISFLTEDMQKRIKGLSINLAENPFDCSACNLYHLHLWFNGGDIIDNPDRYICSNPPELRGNSIFALTANHEDCFGKEINILHVILYVSFASLFISVCGVAAYYHRWGVRLFCFRVKEFVWNYKESSSSYKYDAYIAYCDTQARWIASELQPKLESDKSNIIYFRGRDLLPGDDIIGHVEQIVPECRKVILLLSNDFLMSDWYEMAKQHIIEEIRDCLILVKMEELKEDLVDKRLRYLMKTRTYLEFPAKAEGLALFWEKLRNCIKREKNPDMFLKPLL